MTDRHLSFALETRLRGVGSALTAAELSTLVAQCYGFLDGLRVAKAIDDDARIAFRTKIDDAASDRAKFLVGVADDAIKIAHASMPTHRFITFFESKARNAGIDELKGVPPIRIGRFKPALFGVRFHEAAVDDGLVVAMLFGYHLAHLPQKWINDMETFAQANRCHANTLPLGDTARHRWMEITHHDLSHPHFL